jgi:poly-gamma-glutamate synthesis protein (capsule biosynthesis protein)
MGKSLRRSVLFSLAAGALLMQGHASIAAAQAFQSAAGKEGEVVIVTTGDSIIMRRLQAIGRPGIDRMWGLIRGADAAFTNFETQITDYTFPAAQQSGGTYMSSPAWVIDELEWAGFDMVSVANNHGGDYGQDGLRSTLAALAKSNLEYSGAGENLAFARAPAYVDTKKGRVALISVTSSFPIASMAGAQRKDLRGRPGVNPLRHIRTNSVPQATFDVLKQLTGSEGDKISYGGAEFVVGDEISSSTKANPHDMRELTASIKDAKAQADFVVVSIHHHDFENPAERLQPAAFGIEFAHAAIDAGADIVTGHGYHMLRGIEIHKGKPILYSLGDFLFENDLVRFQPADNYEKVGLTSDNLVSEFYSARSNNDTGRYSVDRRYWQTVIAEAVFSQDGNKLTALRLHPVSLNWYDSKRSTRGQPAPASPKESEEIFEDIRKNSAPFGTKFDYRNGLITVVLE